jgi:hypothetical protein
MLVRYRGILVWLPADAKYFSLLQSFGTGPCFAPSFLFKGYQGRFCLEIKWPGREADHLLATVSSVKDAWGCSLPPLLHMPWWLLRRYLMLFIEYHLYGRFCYWGCQTELAEYSGLLACYVMSLGKQLPSIWKIIVPSYSVLSISR